MARAGAGLGLHVPAGHRRLPVGNLAAAAVGNLAEVAAGRTLAVLGNYSSVKRRRRGGCYINLKRPKKKIDIYGRVKLVSQ